MASVRSSRSTGRRRSTRSKPFSPAMPRPRTIRRSSTISRSPYEGLGEREKARVRYREVVRRFPTDPNARNALVREVSLDAHLEDWRALGEVGELILARKEIDPAERMLGLGARGLSKIQAGDRDRGDARTSSKGSS